MTVFRTIWFPPGSPFPAWADHETEDAAEAAVLVKSREIQGEVAIVPLDTQTLGDA